MNRKISKLIISLGVISMFLFSFHVTSSLLVKPVYATEEKEESNKNDKKEESKETTKTPQEQQAETSGCNSYVTQEERDQCVKDRSSGLVTPSFYTMAIMSLDSSVSSVELNQNYIKNFSNSSSTALVYDLSLFDGDTILMHMINIFIGLFELVGQMISLVVLIVYNVASSSFWETIIQGALNTFDKAIFNWGDPNSWFMKILFLFGSLAVANRLMQTKGQIFTIKTVVQTVTQVVISCMMIVFIAQYGRGIIGKVETMATSSVVQNFNLLNDQYDASLPLEVNVKSQIFDIMQKQGFVLRHFGVTSSSQISDVNSGDYDSSDKGNKISESGEARVQRLLDDPSKDNAAKERKEYGNTQIAYNSGRCLAILGISIVFLVHRFFMAILIGGASFLLLAVGVFKEITIATSTYGLVLMLFRKDKKIAGEWFLGRMKWLIAFILSSLIFNVLLSFIIILINGVSGLGVSLLIILPIDIVLVFAMVYVVKNAPELWQKFNAKFDPEGDGVINIAKGVIGGNITPMDMYNRFKENDSEDANNVENGDSKSGTMNSVKDRMDLTETDELEETSDEGNELPEEQSGDAVLATDNEELKESNENNKKLPEEQGESSNENDENTALSKGDDDLEEVGEKGNELPEEQSEDTVLATDNEELKESNENNEKSLEAQDESSNENDENTALSKGDDDLEETGEEGNELPEEQSGDTVLATNNEELKDTNENLALSNENDDLEETGEKGNELSKKLNEELKESNESNGKLPEEQIVSSENIATTIENDLSEEREMNELLKNMDSVSVTEKNDAENIIQDIEKDMQKMNIEEEKEKQMDDFMEDIWDD